jgi:hypothetical protein
MGNPKKKVDSGPALYEAQISLAVVPGYFACYPDLRVGWERATEGPTPSRGRVNWSRRGQLVEKDIGSTGRDFRFRPSP